MEYTDITCPQEASDILSARSLFTVLLERIAGTPFEDLPKYLPEELATMAQNYGLAAAKYYATIDSEKAVVRHDAWHKVNNSATSLKMFPKILRVEAASLLQISQQNPVGNDGENTYSLAAQRLSRIANLLENSK